MAAAPDPRPCKARFRTLYAEKSQNPLNSVPPSPLSLSKGFLSPPVFQLQNNASLLACLHSVIKTLANGLGPFVRKVHFKCVGVCQDVAASTVRYSHLSLAS